VRTARWKYISYTGLEGMDELYDLRSDPHETRNLAGDPAAREDLARMREELERLRRETK
jgi:arylsulfatase A-like enzyme